MYHYAYVNVSCSGSMLLSVWATPEYLALSACYKINSGGPQWTGMSAHTVSKIMLSLCPVQDPQGTALRSPPTTTHSTTPLVQSIHRLFFTDPPPSNGFTTILLIIDCFTKYCCLVPLKGLHTAMETAQVISPVYGLYGSVYDSASLSITWIIPFSSVLAYTYSVPFMIYDFFYFI